MHKIDEGYRHRYNQKEMDRMFEECGKNTFKCKCGYSILITNKEKRKVCNYCGTLVFRNKKDEFFFKIKSLI